MNDDGRTVEEIGPLNIVIVRRNDSAGTPNMALLRSLCLSAEQQQS
jgi:hypothetical protein